MYSFNKKNNGGFTFIELIVTISLFLLLAGIGMGTYFRYYSFSLIKNDVNSVSAIIRETRFKSLKNPTNSNYGIHLNPVLQTVTSFCDTYNPLDTANIEVQLEQLDIQILNLNPNIGTTNEIIFEAQTGKTNNYGDFTIGDNNFSNTISINSQGVIE